MAAPKKTSTRTSARPARNGPPRDVEQEVTDRLVAAIEAGGLPPWRCAHESNTMVLPQKQFTGEAFRGINVLILWVQAMTMNWTSPRWFTFKQAKAEGGSVRKGEKGIQVIFYKPLEERMADRATRKKQPTGEDNEPTRAVMRSYTVFNEAQIDGLPLAAEPEVRVDAPQATPGEAVMEMAHRMRDRSGLGLDNAPGESVYNVLTDRVSVPEVFFDTAGADVTLAHELIHATGHASRLDRFARNKEVYGNRRGMYAMEELVAEIGALFVCAELGVEFETEFLNSSAYIQGWLKGLKSDKRFIFKAAAEASKAAKFAIDPPVAPARIDEQKAVTA